MSNEITKDKIIIEITSSSEECEKIRDEGMFFEAIANALYLERKDIKEVVKTNV